MYTIAGGARQDKRTALDAFDSLAEQEQYRNNANEQIEEAEAAQKKSALGTVGGMVAAEGVKSAMVAEGAAAAGTTTAAGTTAAGTTAAGTTAATTTAAGTSAGGAVTSTLAAIPGWGWMALGGLALLSAGGVFD